jgi:hypothetical protein
LLLPPHERPWEALPRKTTPWLASGVSVTRLSVPFIPAMSKRRSPAALAIVVEIVVTSRKLEAADDLTGETGSTPLNVTVPTKMLQVLLPWFGTSTDAVPTGGFTRYHMPVVPTRASGKPA